MGQQHWGSLKIVISYLYGQAIEPWSGLTFVHCSHESASARRSRVKVHAVKGVDARLSSVSACTVKMLGQ